MTTPWDGQQQGGQRAGAGKRDASRWAFPQPQPGERVLHAWVIDDCHYVLIALATETDQADPDGAYRLRVFGYAAFDEADQWAAASPGPWDALRAKLNGEMATLAASWFGRLRQADLSQADDWYATLAASLGDGIIQITLVGGGTIDRGRPAA